VIARARALLDDDAEGLRAAHERFRELGARYELARTGWMLGVEARAEAGELFARLRCRPPVYLRERAR
jgi:hypothetical protein